MMKVTYQHIFKINILTKEIYNKISQEDQHFMTIFSEWLKDFSDEELIAYTNVMNTIHDRQTELLENSFSKSEYDI